MGRKPRGRVRQELELHVVAEQLVPFPQAIGAVLVERLEADLAFDAGGDAPNEIARLRESEVHALRTERTRHVSRVARQPHASSTEAPNEAALEVNHRAPIQALYPVGEPRRTRDE